MSTDPLGHPPAGVHSLWRLRGYLRPHLRALVDHGRHRAGRGRPVDRDPAGHQGDHRRPDHRRRRSARVLPLGLLALGLGVLEAVLICVRRWVQSDAVLGIETADAPRPLRAAPGSCRWRSTASGSPGSCSPGSTTDLSRDPPVRRLRAAVPGHQHPPADRGDRVLLHMYWPLGLVVAAAAIPIVVLSDALREAATSWSPAGSRTSRATSPRCAEEGAVGIRVIKSFGRGRARLRPVRRGRPHALRHLDGQGPAVGEVLDLPRGDPQLRRRGRAAARRARRRPRRRSPPAAWSPSSP